MPWSYHRTLLVHTVVLFYFIISFTRFILQPPPHTECMIISLSLSLSLLFFFFKVFLNNNLCMVLHMNLESKDMIDVIHVLLVVLQVLI